MTDPERAAATQLRNIETKTGAAIAELRSAVHQSGHVKHGEVRAWAMERYGLGYGDANALASVCLASDEPAMSLEDAVGAIYAGGKAHLRAVHDRVMAELATMGEFEVSPKKAYVSLRRKKQFATIGPKNNTKAELGINLKEDVGSERVVAQKPGGMCQFAVALAVPEDVDAEVVSALRKAFEAVG